MGKSQKNHKNNERNGKAATVVHLYNPLLSYNILSTKLIDFHSGAKELSPYFSLFFTNPTPTHTHTISEWQIDG
jgi:hypothetical protein